jgi:hypothetical protein
VDAYLLDAAGTVVAVVLTLAVFSYLIGDNALFRLAEHIFVGASVGYAAVVVFHGVLVPKLLAPLIEALRSGNWWQLPWLLIPLVLGLLLLTRSSRRLPFLSWLGGFSIAVLLGVGAALAISGALLGTLLPQSEATADISYYVPRYGYFLGFTSGLVVLVGATGALLHFTFSAGGEGLLARLRNLVVGTWGGLGRWFIVIAFGALLATTFMSRLALLASRIEFLMLSLSALLGG